MPQDPIPGLSPEELYKRKLREEALIDGLPQQVRNSKAQELLRVVLGSSGQKLDPNSYKRSFDISNPFDKFKDESSPNINAAYHSATRDYPGLASKRVTGLYDLPDDDTDVKGRYNLFSGRMGIRRILGGKELSQNDLRDTILHELSHAVGTEDDIGNYEMDKPISAYNISAASQQLHEDVNLPIEGSVYDKKKRIKGLR